MKPDLLGATTVAIILALGGAASAQDASAKEANPAASPRLPDLVVKPQAAARAVYKTTLFSFTASGGSYNVLPAGYNELDTAVRINCKDLAGCTVTSSLMAQVSSRVDGNQNAFCMMIDGGSVDTCPYQGYLDVADGNVVQNYLGIGTVSQGQHTVQSQIYLQGDGRVLNYNIVYTVLTP